MSTTLTIIESGLNARSTALGAAAGGFAKSDRIIAVVMATVQRQPELLECDPASVVAAVEKATSDGLLLDGRDAALVVYNTKRGNDWVKMAQYIPMFQGLLRRIYASQKVSSISATIVYAKEMEIDPALGRARFEYQAGDNENIRHEPILTGERGKASLVYSIAQMRDGSKSRCVMTMDEVLRIAKMQKKNVDNEGKLKGIWLTHFIEMAKKTCLRRHAKVLPMDDRGRNAFESFDDVVMDPGEDGIVIDHDESAPPTPARPTKQRGAAAAMLKGQATAEPPHDPETGEIRDEAPVDATYEDVI